MVYPQRRPHWREVLVLPCLIKKGPPLLTALRDSANLKQDENLQTQVSKQSSAVPQKNEATL